MRRFWEARPPAEKVEAGKDAIEFHYGSNNSRTHPGYTEDRALLLSEQNTFAVFDGMGGVKNGELAAVTAQEVVERYINSLEPNLTPAQIQDGLASALQAAHDQIAGFPKDNKKSFGPGTTADILKFQPGPNGKLWAVFAHIGDGRIYLFRKGSGLTCLTLDHNEKIRRAGSDPNEQSAAQTQMSNSHNQPDLNKRNEIIGWLGQPAQYGKLRIDTGAVQVEPGTVIAICSDGVSDPLIQNQNTKPGYFSVEQGLEIALEKGPDAAVSRILKEVELVNDQGMEQNPRAKEDDQTLIVIRAL